MVPSLAGWLGLVSPHEEFPIARYVSQSAPSDEARQQGLAEEMVRVQVVGLHYGVGVGPGGVMETVPEEQREIQAVVYVSLTQPTPEYDSVHSVHRHHYPRIVVTMSSVMQARKVEEHIVGTYRTQGGHTTFFEFSVNELIKRSQSVFPLFFTAPL